MAPKTPSKTTQVSEVKLPKWVDAASQSNYKFAEDIANKPLQQFQGDTVADLSPETLKAFDFFKQNMGAGSGAFNNAADTFKALTGFSATPLKVGASTVDNQNVNSTNVASQAVKAGMLKDVNIDDYMNPWIDNVETKALGALDDSRIQALMGNADAASKANAFGGSRSAIVDAVTNSESAKSAGLLSADLRKSGFDTAMGLAGKDIDSRLTADMFNADGSLKAQGMNQAAGLAASTSNASNDLAAKLANQGTALDASKANSSNALQAALASAGIRMNAGAGALDVGGAQRDMFKENVAGLSTIGSTKQNQAQKEIDANVAKFAEKEGYDLERLNILLSSLGMSPYGKTETTTKTGQAGSPGTDWAQLGMGGLSFLAGLPMMSDRDAKTDIERLGKDKVTGLTMYAYRYKKDPKTYPKVVGPMAQDVEKQYPGSTRRINGKLIIDMVAAI